MAKAHIKTADGAQIVIEGSPEEVAIIVAKIQGVVDEPRERGRKAPRAKEPTPKRKKATISELVLGLKADGFFDNPRRLGDVTQTLEERGFMYPVTTLSGVMLSLVQKKELTRKKVDGVWVYGKR